MKPILPRPLLYRALVSTTFLSVACGGGDGDSRGGGAGGTSLSGGDTTGTSDASTAATTMGSATDGGTSSSSTGSTGPGGGPCSASTDCGPDEACVDMTCVPTDGPCDTDADCTGDTYCCAAGCLPDGEMGGVCVPYEPGQTNDACVGDVDIGLFEPSVQCEWTEPDAGDPFPNHKNVLTTPLVADLPYDSGAAGEIVIVTYNWTDGGAEAAAGIDPNYFGVVRILNGQTCEQHAVLDDPLNRAIASSPPAIGDIDGDGAAEIVTQRAVTGLVAYRWNPVMQTYATFWASTGSDISGAGRWDGPALHDLDDDGVAEVISASEVYDGLTGTRLNPGQVLPGAGAGTIAVLGDLDQDGAVELVATDVYRWNVGTNQWEFAYPGGPGGRHYGFADFGTPGATPNDFDPTTFDGRAEIVTVANDAVYLHTLEGQELLAVTTGIMGGGPPTIGDFDADGRPEFASAGGNFYRVFDLDCAGAPAGCAGNFVRWAQASQDLSSRTTGSSIFDFEGDGQDEAVYGDECFLRVYEGATGEVLYSAARTSCTWYENPVVADPDKDENTEILVGSNPNCSVTCPAVDPIHRGERCEDGTDCASGVCDAGFCRCTGDPECSPGHTCTAPPAGTPGAGNTCRATHPPGIALTGIRVLRDALDRWASSRPLWNQHAYSITNVEDDLSIPKTSAWQQNFADPALNNYRRNEQGAATAEDMPDITGKLEETACNLEDGKVTLVGTVCNRGNKAVGAALPATFYLGDPMIGMNLCTAYTPAPVPVGDCLEVSCEIPNTVQGTITMVVNDDGMGGKATVECIETNNTDTVDIDACLPPG
ncbi:MAG: hypothetical protein D6705_09795 [Deltaproteobacteria bacterium]|nr:MAG: hypothetical protein D6705_09795 [Deltaproteobacteria bacterium]